jgi:hypothetical protein
MKKPDYYLPHLLELLAAAVGTPDVCRWVVSTRARAKQWASENQRGLWLVAKGKRIEEHTNRGAKYHV